VAVSEVAEWTEKFVAAEVPKRTAVVPAKLVPMIVTEVPPAAGPEEGLSALTVGEDGGGEAVKVNWSAGASTGEVPSPVVTVTSTVPVPAGVAAVICELVFTMKAAAASVPNVTAVAPARLVPVTVTVAPPWMGPEEGFKPVTVGGGGGVEEKVNWSAGALIAEVPPAVVTVMSTAPTDSGGEMPAIWVADTGKKVAETVPNLTVVAPERSVPVMVTEVPPPVGPVLGLTPVTDGAGGGAPSDALRSTPIEDDVFAGDCGAAGDAAPETSGSKAATFPEAVKA